MQQPDYDKPRKGGVLVQLILFMSGFFWAAKHDMNRLEKLIMTLQESFRAYAVRRDEYDARQEAATDILTQALTGITGDVKGLKDEIKKLQDSAGQVTPEDQATIDRLQAKAEAATVRVEAVATALKTLNEETPEVPTIPPA